jgi:chaperone modulatory protein CbpM
MTASDYISIHTGTIIEDNHMTLEQICQLCDTNSDWIFSLIQENIIEPEPFSLDTPGLHFSGDCLIKVRSALRLQRDLGVNLEGVALILDLMEELTDLRAKLPQPVEPE